MLYGRLSCHRKMEIFLTLQSQSEFKEEQFITLQAAEPHTDPKDLTDPATHTGLIHQTYSQSPTLATASCFGIRFKEIKNSKETNPLAEYLPPTTHLVAGLSLKAEVT